ncbi:hypothetical protein [Laceyella putida]|uniref:Uncharacterized protein n=1 Tax=Laceyella putida TaxID=110101 RepID=A0ABW2RIY2_9BACL
MSSAKKATNGRVNERAQANGTVFSSNNCTYYMEWGNELGYEKTKEDLCRVLAKIELGI